MFLGPGTPDAMISGLWIPPPPVCDFCVVDPPPFVISGPKKPPCMRFLGCGHPLFEMSGRCNPPVNDFWDGDPPQLTLLGCRSPMFVLAVLWTPPLFQQGLYPNPVISVDL